MWHQLAKNWSKEEKKASEILCSNCKHLHTNLKHQKHRSTDVSPAWKATRLQSPSHFKLKYLSPASVAARRKATQAEHSADKAKLTRHEELELPLDDEQFDELCDVMKKIEETCPDELTKIFREGGDNVVGNRVHDFWETDKPNAKNNFLRTNTKMVSSTMAICLILMVQNIIENGNRTNRWSLITIRVSEVRLCVLLTGALSPSCICLQSCSL